MSAHGRVVDLRSDTVTRPTAGMRAAMARAEVGDDVFRDDPTVLALQQHVAALLGKEAALFMPSGTQSNLAAIMSHCARGDAYLAGTHQHCYRCEAGGAAVLAGVQPQPLPQQPDGTLALADIAAAIHPDDEHFARTRLLALENTHRGNVLSQPYVAQALALAAAHGLVTHLDGARLFNAAAALRCSVAELARGFDSVSVCFSKGLGAPVGSALAGSAEFIARAYRARKILGGALRQSGVLAAAALYALDHHVERLADDHALAQRLARALAGIDGLQVQPPQTNMVWVGVAGGRGPALIAHLAERGVLATGDDTLRLVTHLDADRAGVDRAVAAAQSFFEGA